MTPQDFGKLMKQGLRGYSRSSQPGADRVTKVLYRDKFTNLLNGDDEAAVHYRLPSNDKKHKPTTWEKHYLVRQESGRKRARRLLTTPGFPEGVLKLARRWGLGTYLCEVDHFQFTHATVCGLTAWRTVLKHVSQKYSAERWEDYGNHLRALAQQFAEDLAPDRITEGVREWFSHMPRSVFDRELLDLMDNYGLGPPWQRSIEVLLLTGKLYVPERYSRLVITRKEDGDRVFIELFGQTRLADIKDVWWRAKPFRECVLPEQASRQRPSPQTDRELETEAQLADGKTISNITGDPTTYLSYTEEMRLREALRKGQERQTKRRDDEAGVPTAPDVPDWLERQATEVTEGGRELHF